MSNAITRVVKKILAGKIRGGPFVGMAHLDQSAGSMLLPKILGAYEKEIYPWLIPMIKRSTNTIVDVGCAEGYYANGALYINPQVHVIAYDLDATARALCQTMADRNGVAERMKIRGLCDAKEALVRGV